jgi:hypothetical protein
MSDHYDYGYPARNSPGAEPVGSTWEFRTEFFNSCNHAQFLNPDGNIAGNFGKEQVNATRRFGRLCTPEKAPHTGQTRIYRVYSADKPRIGSSAAP